MSGKSLKDTKNLAGDKLDKFNEKLSIAKAKMSQNPLKGGMPFVYAFIATKEHHLWDEFPKYIDGDGQEKTMETAATDGKKYYWHPSFLDRLKHTELMIVMAHETYHIVMQHCNRGRIFGKNMAVWNLAVDYVVNSAIEYDMRTNNTVNSYECDKAFENNSEHPIWKGGFGKPQTLKKLLKDIEASFKNKKPKTVKQKKPLEKVVFADFSVHKRSAESIYDEIMSKIKKCGGQGDLNDLLAELGLEDGMDGHIEVDISRGKLLEEILAAATSAKKLCGNVPGAIEDELKSLQEPKLRWQDLVRHAMQSIRQDKGNQNDWSRLRRRGLALGLYIPRKKDQTIRWLAMLDTSGSMTSEDMVYAVSQLKVLDGRSKGMVVPCDAQPYWDKMVNIHSMCDLPKIKPVGRGGTTFDSFFTDYKKHIREHIDLIIVLTDGYVSINCPKPPVDVVWVITNNNMPSVPFGRVAPLRTY